MNVIVCKCDGRTMCVYHKYTVCTASTAHRNVCVCVCVFSNVYTHVANNRKTDRQTHARVCVRCGLYRLATSSIATFTRQRQCYIDYPPSRQSV